MPLLKKSKINIIIFHYKKLKEKSKLNPKETEEGNSNIRVEINETESRKTIEKISKIKSWFFEKINKIQTLVRLTKEKRDDLNYKNQ